MKLGLMGALAEELGPVIARAQGQSDRIGGREFWSGQWHQQHFVAVLSRIGKVAAASTAALLIQRHRVDAIVFTGVAGGLAQGVRVADAVVATEFLQHDMDASPLFPRHVVPLDNLSRYPTDPDWTRRLHQAATRAMQQMVTQWPQGWNGIDLKHSRVHQGLIQIGRAHV